MGNQKKGKAKSKALKTILTPDGIAAFAHLREPDETFETKHSINVFFDPSKPKDKAFLKLLKKLENAWLVENNKKARPPKAYPGCVKKADEKLAELTGVKLGTPFIKFETKPKQDSRDFGFIYRL